MTDLTRADVEPGWAVADVEVATVWTYPEAPRAVDAPALADPPALAAWTTVLNPGDRLDLHGRTETQLLRGEPVLVAEVTAEWSRVLAPWQPSPKDPRGYPGWVRSAHLVAAGEPAPRTPTIPIPDRATIAEAAREFLGVRYLWGGTSPHGFDCSGLVHYCYRRAGVVVPRDACAQQQLAVPVTLGEERRGDLYFFGTESRVSHVGFVTDPGHMLHAPESDGRGAIEETTLTADRLSTLVSVGRLPMA